MSDWLTEILTKAGAHAALLLPAQIFGVKTPNGCMRPDAGRPVERRAERCWSSCRRSCCCFLFIGILEDSGYLARAALIADRVMRAIGLNGKAFIPLLSSAYACAVPAIMATRTIENRRERIATIHGGPVHDVLGAAADLHADHCGVHSQPALPGR